MLVRYKATGREAHSSNFNLSAVGEVVTEDDSAFIHELDIFIPSKGWVDMSTAFKSHDIIVDNLFTSFFEPTNEKDRERGHTL
jgi:hypothetical protein